MGISRTSRHKRSASGAQRLGRQPANTKLGAKRVHTVRVRGGNLKFRALRLEAGNFAWGSETVTRKTRIIGVVRLQRIEQRTRPNNTLVKSAIIQIDATPFRQWYEAHVSDIAISVDFSPADEEPKKVSQHVQRILDERKKGSSELRMTSSQFAAGRLYAAISSRPGQSGRADGYILEGKELEVCLSLG
ncbi:ribosomal protein [Salix suchowensis]|nr:ribosomal protein [Salix suchowensis]